jgi:hypothetical protein
MLGHRDMTPPGQGLAGQKQARNPVAGIDVVDALHRTWSRRKGLSGLADQLLEGLVQAHHRTLGILRAVVDLQHIFHVVDELS